MNPRVFLAAAMIGLPLFGWAILQLSLGALLAVGAVLIVVILVCGYAIHGLAATDAPAPAAAQRPPWAATDVHPTHVPTEQVVVVPDELSEAITGLLNRLDGTDKRLDGLGKFVMKNLGPHVAHTPVDPQSPEGKRPRKADHRPLTDLLPGGDQ